MAKIREKEYLEREMQREERRKILQVMNRMLMRFKAREIPVVNYILGLSLRLGRSDTNSITTGVPTRDSPNPLLLALVSNHQYDFDPNLDQTLTP